MEKFNWNLKFPRGHSPVYLCYHKKDKKLEDKSIGFYNQKKEKNNNGGKWTLKYEPLNVLTYAWWKCHKESERRQKYSKK